MVQYIMHENIDHTCKSIREGTNNGIATTYLKRVVAACPMQRNNAKLAHLNNNEAN